MTIIDRAVGTKPEALRGSARVLVVDDEGGVRRALQRLMESGGHSAEVAADAKEARAALQREHFDLVLMDMNIPGDSGLALIEEVNDHYKNTATIMVTGQDSVELATLATKAGAYGYIIKPFGMSEVTIAVINALRRLELEIGSRRRTDDLEAAVLARTTELWGAVRDLEYAKQELVDAHAQTIERLSMAAEFRDDDTGKHIERMSRYCEILWNAYGEDDSRGQEIRLASVMHDVGKIGIPDNIMLKPGKLTPEERAVMETHAEIGHRILAGSDSQLLKVAAEIALTHHERWDGTGYPRQLVGTEIPIEGRIAALADVFDALTTNRVYRKAFTLPEALTFIRAGKGSHFDPQAVEKFFECLPLLLDVLHEISDSD